MEKVYVKSELIWETEFTESSDALKTETIADNTATEQDKNTWENIYDTVVKTDPDDHKIGNNASTDNINDTVVFKTGADIDNTALKLESDVSSDSVNINDTDVRKTETDCYNNTELETRADADNTANNASSENNNDTVSLKTEPNHGNAKPKLENFPSPINITVTVLKAEPDVDSVENKATSDNINKTVALKTEADLHNDITRKVNLSFVDDTGPKSLHVEKPKRKYKPKPKKEHVCEICNIKLKHNFLLRNHKRIHTGEKPFTCETCNKSFTRKTILKHHQRTHTGEKPFNCDICNKPFAYKTHLVEHKRIHTGEKSVLVQRMQQAV